MDRNTRTMSSSMQLPETLIHRIQSLLTREEAARTTLLSKSWRNAWSTRPTIEIDQSHIPKHYSYLPKYKDTDALIEFATNTFRRYEESNLTIDTFVMSLQIIYYVSFGLAEQWTSKALALGATDLTFRLPDENTSIPLPKVSRLENVVRLSVRCFKIDRLKVIIKCTGLKSLTLSHFAIIPDQFFDILSRFPLIEYLSLSDITTSNDGLVVTRSSPPKIIFHKLRSFVLSQFQSQIQMKELFLGHLSSMFPNLKDLTLGLNSPKPYFPYRLADERIRNISSDTLETLNLKYPKTGEGFMIQGVTLDVPSIRKFTFEGLWIPKLRFSPTPVGGQWESHVSITNRGDMSTAWFSRLSQLLKKLKGSKIHLCLHFRFKESFDYEAGEIDGLNVYEVEDLTLDMNDLPSMSCYAVLDGLFRTCRPKTITQHDDDGINTRKNDLFLCRSLERGMQLKGILHPTQFMYGLLDLVELDAQQLFDGVWRKQPLGCILDDDSTSQQRRRFRLQLKWSCPLDQYMRHSDDDDDDNIEADDDGEYQEWWPGPDPDWETWVCNCR